MDQLVTACFDSSAEPRWLPLWGTKRTSDRINKATGWTRWCVGFTGHSQSHAPAVVTIRKRAARSFVSGQPCWLVPRGVAVVGFPLQPADSHVAFQAPPDFTCNAYTSPSTWADQHVWIKASATVLNLLIILTVQSLFILIFYQNGEKIWNSNILVLILPHSYQHPLRLWKTLFYVIME